MKVIGNAMNSRFANDATRKIKRRRKIAEPDYCTNLIFPRNRRVFFSFGVSFSFFQEPFSGLVCERNLHAVRLRDAVDVGKKSGASKRRWRGGEREAIPSTSLQQLSFRLKEGDEK